MKPNLLIRFIPNTPKETKNALVNSLGLGGNFQGEAYYATFESEEELEEFRRYFYAAAHINPKGAFNIAKESLYPDGTVPQVSTLITTIEVTGDGEQLDQVEAGLESAGRLREKTREEGKGLFRVELVDEMELETVGNLLAFLTGNPNSVRLVHEEGENDRT